MSALTADTGRRHRQAGHGIRARWVSGVDAGALGVLLCLIVIFSAVAPGFATVDNARSIGISIAVVACLAIGQNLVIMTGEIDVSVGSIVALAGFVAGPVGVRTENLFLTVVCSLAIGAAAGLVNGLLVAYTPVPSIVVTLGTLYVFQGLALIRSDSHNIVSFPASASSFGSGNLLGVPRGLMVVLAAFLILLLVRRHTNWGRDLLPTGEHRAAARTMGVRVRAELVGVYIASGLAAGLGTVIYLGAVGGMQTSIVDSNLALQVIAACAVGGTSIEGGRGTDLAPLTGAAIVGVITAGVVILGVPGVWISCAYGACLLLAVARDRIRDLALSRRRTRG
ncbi:MAG: ABC transporter permease [Nocardioides sp.]|uniref:ABC transporter permease n=1 Tax=Nocardioides sp. TaxID=35761 RepID=UPI0039E63CE2